MIDAGEHVWAPSTIASSTGVTVTVWATFQLAVVNVNGVGAKVHCVDVPIVTVILAEGCKLNTTVNAPVLPAVSVAALSVVTIVIVPTSSSAMVFVAASGAPSVATPEVTAVKVIITVSPGSVIKSLITGIEIVAVVARAGIVTVPESAVKSVPEVAVPETV